MPLQFWSTGAALIWVKYGAPGFTKPGFSGLSGPQALGTAENFPRLEGRPGWYPVVNDITGPEKPADLSFAGQDAVAAFNLTMWDEAVAQDLEVFPGPSSATIGGGVNAPGSWGWDDVGTLMVTEGHTFEAWVQFLFPGSPKHLSMAALPSGYHLPCCTFLGPWSLEPGSKAAKRQMVWQALPQISVSAKSFTLYDYDMTAIQNLDIAGGGTMA